MPKTKPTNPAKPVARPAAPRPEVPLAPQPRGGTEPSGGAPRPQLPLVPVVAPIPAPVPAPGPAPEVAVPPADLASRIEAACEFIRSRKEAHAAAIAWEVGEYLFEKTFGGDLEYLESKDRTKPDSLKEISERTGIHRVRLASWVRAYVARKYLGPEGIDPELSMTEFEALRPLIGYPSAAKAALELRDRLRLTTQDLGALVVAWKRLLDEGVGLAELLERPLPPTVSPRPSRRARRRAARRPDLTIPRLLSIVLRWLERCELSAEHRGILAVRLSSLRDSLQAPSLDPDRERARLAPSRVPAEPAALRHVEGRVGEGVLAAAVAFIEQAMRSHTLQFAVEVGRYLFEHIYDGDRALFHNGGHAWQSDSIRRIADDERVGLEPQFLYRAIHVYLVQQQLEAATQEPLPELPASTWNALWPLEDAAGVLVPVVRWAVEEKVAVRPVEAVAAVAETFLAQGGTIEDLLWTSRHLGPQTPFQRISRILDVVESLVARSPVAGSGVSKSVAIIGSCLGVLAA